MTPWKEIDAELEEFSELYQSKLNDPQVRHMLTERYEAYEEYFVGKPVPMSVERGTIIEQFDGDLGHYMSFFPGANASTIIFDPSGITGPYAMSLKTQNAIRRMFKKRNIQFYDTRPYGIQEHERDTWCQTYSIAMLNPALQSYVTDIQETQDSTQRISKTADLVLEVCNRLIHYRALDAQYRPLVMRVYRHFNAYYDDRHWKERRNLMKTM